jgi:iron complex outermembrane receptor protein
MQIKRKKLSAALIGVFGAGFLWAAGEASAQQAQRVEKIEVTGTNIKRTDTETPSVVQVITREQIEKSGATSVAELLRNVPAIAGGSVQDFDRGTGFNSGNATASLRGLGSVATLVLLNGRRIAAAPVADPNSGQGTAYNLNTIPLSAIERIDILKDGASAIYGSDAIAGVINIILRKDYRGGEITWNHWQKLDQFTDQNYRAEQLTGTIGFGDLTKDRYNVMLSAEWYKREPVWIRDSGSGVQSGLYRTLNGRDVANGSAITSPPNYRRETPAGSGLYNSTAGRLAVDPRCPAEHRVSVTSTIQECRTNQFDYLQLVTNQERGGLLGRGTMQLTSNITGFLEAGFSRTENKYPFSPPTLDAAAPTTWFNRAGQRFTYTLALPPGHPDNPNNFNMGLRYRFVDLGIPEQKVTQDAGRVVAGVNGTSGAWDWETAVMYASNQIDSTRNDRLYLPALTTAVSSGAYRFGSATNPQSLLDSLHPSFTSNGDSKVTSWDLKGSRDVWNLPAGPIALAAGLEVRHEEMNIVSDPRLVAGDFVGIASTGMDGSRVVWSAYGELSIPILKNLEAQAALRTDHYSDFGYANTPKFGFKWSATESLAARGTWAKGFRAPSLFQNSTAQVQAFLNNTQDPVRCPNGPNALPPGAETTDCAVSLSALISANRSLTPEESVSHSLGFIWAPSTAFSLSVDRWYVKRENFIDIYDTGTVLRNENNPNFTGGQVLRNTNPASWLPGVPNSGPLQSILIGFGNFGNHAVAGYDLDIVGKWPMGAWGRLRLDANGTYYDKYQVQLFKDSAYISSLGNFFWFPVPRFKGVATATWETGAWQFLGRVNYTGGFDDGQPSDDGTATNAFSCYRSATVQAQGYGGSCAVSAWETYDVGVSYEGIKNLKLSALIRNVTDVPAPYFATTNGSTTTLGYYPAFYNPYGRYFQFSVTYKFK